MPEREPVGHLPARQTPWFDQSDTVSPVQSCQFRDRTRQSALEYGDYGKPRPALIVQSDFFDAHPSVIVLLVTGDLRETPLFRVAVEPTDANALRKTSQVMVDKCITVPREKIGGIFGLLDAGHLLVVERCLGVFLRIAK